MATENGDNAAPDSWDQDIDSQDGAPAGDNLAKPFSNLNVNAPTFVPGQNIYAAEFVPSFVNKSPEGN